MFVLCFTLELGLVELAVFFQTGNGGAEYIDIMLAGKRECCDFDCIALVLANEPSGGHKELDTKVFGLGNIVFAVGVARKALDTLAVIFCKTYGALGNCKLFFCQDNKDVLLNTVASQIAFQREEHFAVAAELFGKKGDCGRCKLLQFNHKNMKILQTILLESN